jgi:hypothetical protein
VRLPPLDPRSVLHFASGDCNSRSSSSGTTAAAAAAAAAAVSADSTTSDLPASATLTGKAVQDALHFGHAIECPVKKLLERLQEGRRPALRAHLGRRVQ